MTFPSSPEPASVPVGRPLVAQLDGNGSDGAGTTITGETCAMRWRRVTDTPVDLHPAATSGEVFVYVVRGNADLMVLGGPVNVGAGTLVIIPAGLRHVSARARGTGDVALVEFARHVR